MSEIRVDGKIEIKVSEFRTLLNTTGTKMSKETLSNYILLPDFELTGDPFIDNLCDSLDSGLNEDFSMIYRGYMMHDVMRFNMHIRKTHPAGWDLNYTAYRNVYVNEESLSIYTYCEGDISVRKFQDLESFKSGVESAREFYAEY